MQPTSARYIAKSIQDDRLAAAARDRLLLSVGSDAAKTGPASHRISFVSGLVALAARVAPAAQH